MSNRPVRIDAKFYSDIEHVIRERLIKGKDKVFNAKTPARVTLAISNHPMFRTRIMPDCIKADLPKIKEDKKHE